MKHFFENLRFFEDEILRDAGIKVPDDELQNIVGTVKQKTKDGTQDITK